MVVLIIFTVILQTVINFRMLSIGGKAQTLLRNGPRLLSLKTPKSVFM